MPSVSELKSLPDPGPLSLPSLASGLAVGDSERSLDVGVIPSTLQALEATTMPPIKTAAAMRNCLDIFM